MRKTSLVLLILMFANVMFFSACISMAVAEEKIVLRTVSAFAKPYYEHNYPLYRLQERLKERLSNKVEIKFLGAGDIIKSSEAVSAVSQGIFDMCYIPPAYVVGEIPELTILSVLKPWSWPRCFRNPGFKELLNKAIGERLNVHVLGGFLSNGPMYIVTAKKQVKSVADLKGLKFRAAGPIGSRVSKRLGTACVSMPVSELYESIQRGVVDGGFLNLVTVFDSNIYESVKYITAPPFIEFKAGIWINKKKWESLDPKVRKIIEEENDTIEFEHYGYVRANEGKLKEFTKSKGIIWYDMPDVESKKLRKAVIDDVEEWYLKKCPKYGSQFVDMLSSYF